MLTRLDIKNFALVEELVVDFASGFSAITGETGAGKSIMLDALGLVLGDRASPELIRSGASTADLSAEFNIADITRAATWLAGRDLSDADAPESCLLRRTLGADGRSRAYVNGRPVTLQDIRELAEHLIDIHSQHAHQSLLRRDTQRLLLDEFGGHGQLVRDLTRAHSHWRASLETLEASQRAQKETAERRALLTYQLEELEQLNLEAEEYPQLVAQQKRLAHADAHTRRLATTLAGLDEDDDAVTALLGRLLHALEEIEDDHPALTTARELLASATVNAEEATAELRRYADLLETDPERLETIDARLGELHDLARKHRIRPEELSALQEGITRELASMAYGESRLSALAQTVADAEKAMLGLAAKVSKVRTKAARKLEAAVTGQLVELGMKHARFEAHLEALEDGTCGATGLERVDFRVSANKGLPPGPLGKIASGGELSRISLAIQVVTAATSRIPSLILDEADVGIGGRTAEVVGRLLRNLGEHTQILAVTHLPQVAALAHQHLAVEKSDQDTARVNIRTLDEEDRVSELARMLGGVEVTAQTRAHANEMLTRATSA